MGEDRAPRTGASWVLLGTAVGGGAGYLLSAMAGPLLGAAAYAPFAIFWSALYLLVSAASGIQQEVSRSAHPASGVAEEKTYDTGAVARRFAVMAALVVAAAIVATGPLWLPAALGADWSKLLWPLAFGIASYVVVTVYAGILYGLHLWRPIAVLVILDGIIRLMLVVVAMLMTDDLVVIAWAVVIPFLAAPVIQWPFVRRSVVGAYRLDAAPRRLAANSAKTVVGAAATGVLVSGFPLLLGATTGGAQLQQLAAIVFAVTLTRAPIVVVVIALQSYLIVRFKTHRRTAGAEATRFVSVIAVLTGATAVVLLLWGESAFRALFGSEFALPGVLLAGIVGSAVAIGALCVTGPLVLARSRHTLFTAGWVTAAVVTIAALLLPLPLESRAIVGLWAGPLAGLTVHVLGLGWGRSR